ncbi:MAG TPA: tripartite tricarboxylate transporter substrate binding protein [Burkholderiales bacterium]|nr:tripartite tricarboxylate transporter substrate binding protein [Burkholderiales bacterium]
MPHFSSLIRRLAPGACALLLSAGAHADYPDKPIRLVIPFPAGGTVDVVGRLIANKAAEALKTTIVIDNRPGAGGSIAEDNVAKSPPDGYTMLYTSPGHTINPAIYKKLPFDTEKDLIPVALVATAPEVLIANPAAPFNTFKEFVAYARANPNKLNYSHAGNGTLPHVTMELLLKRAGIQVVPVAYKGAAPAMNDLLAGVVQLKLDTFATSGPMLAAHRLKVLATAARQRMQQLPDVPTVAESGLPGYEASLWMGVMAPAGTAPAIVDKVGRAFLGAVKIPEVRERLTHDGVEILNSDAAAFGAQIRTELKQWRDLVRDAKITAE